jgi:hypothetical protein
MFFLFVMGEGRAPSTALAASTRGWRLMLTGMSAGSVLAVGGKKRLVGATGFEPVTSTV